MKSKNLFGQKFRLSKQVFLIILLIGFALIVVFPLVTGKAKISTPSQNMKNEVKTPINYHTSIIKDTEENENFRQVLFTGPSSQLVVMSIPPNSEVGEETHKYTEQSLFFISGQGEAVLGNEKFPVGPGDVVVVPAGTKHNFRNIGTQNLKLYTVYAPPNHIDGRIHQTKADADKDTADEAIGETEPAK